MTRIMHKLVFHAHVLVSMTVYLSATYLGVGYKTDQVP